MDTLGKLSREQLRLQARALRLANPNFFGTLTDSPFPPIVKISDDTSYEELACVGYHPQLERLEGVVYIKKPAGYNGGICTNGSQEYVRFFLSHDNGATWQDLGMTSFSAYDIPDNPRLECAVTLPIDPRRIFCFVENLPRVRAILSWNDPPTPGDPDFPVVWGNVVEVDIQVEPGWDFVLGTVLEQAKVKLPANFEALLDLQQPVAMTKAKPLGMLERHRLYREAKVPGHRYLYPEISTLAAGSAVGQKQMLESFTQPLLELDVSIADIIAELFATDGNTSYERLDCIGYDPNREALAGVLTVKLPYGFSGSLCTPGSEEYVAFWVDWGDGAGWTYIDTASVTVHDIRALPADGLKYAVYLPVDVSAKRQSCRRGPRIAKVRAILSWEQAPPPGDPDWRPHWGNRLETSIMLAPGKPFAVGTPNIAIIGGIGIADIHVTGNGRTKPSALFALTGDPADAWGLHRECPFGGRVVIQGYPSPGLQYRIRVRNTVTGAQTVLMDKIRTVDLWGVGTWRTPDPTGLFTYLDTSLNLDNVLAWWDTAGDELWEVQLEIPQPGGGVLATPWYRVQLDNTAPNPVEIHIDSGGDCKDFAVGVVIDGHFKARDANFGAYSIYTLPYSAPAGHLNPTSGYAQTGTSPHDDEWHLNTAGMAVCGYVVYLSVADRTIVGSSPYGHHWNSASVGFCLRAK